MKFIILSVLFAVAMTQAMEPTPTLAVRTTAWTACMKIKSNTRRLQAMVPSLAQSECNRVKYQRCYCEHKASAGRRLQAIDYRVTCENQSGAGSGHVARRLQAIVKPWTTIDCSTACFNDCVADKHQVAGNRRLQAMATITQQCRTTCNTTTAVAGSVNDLRATCFKNKACL